MKKYILVVVILTFCFSPLYSQVNYSEEYGKITQYEMSMTEYENDPEAEALVIYDLGNYYFRADNVEGLLLNMEKVTKIKILKQEGIKYANIEIPFYVDGNTREYIEDIEATTYNFENGQLLKKKLDSKNVFEEKLNNDVYIKKIALSDVRVGSVIEFKYKIASPFFVHMREWKFQDKIPVVHSQLVYKAIPYYEYTYIMKGTNQFHEFKSKELNNEENIGRYKYKEIAYTFGMKNLPAFRDEEYITSDRDYMVAINFQISRIFYPNGGNREYISTWPALCDSFLKHEDFGKYIKNSEKEAKKIIMDFKLEGKTKLGQAIEITQYVKNMSTWNGFHGKFTSKKASDFVKQKSGNVADINLFLLGCFNAAGIPANPVVISTRNNGRVDKSHPFEQFLNYVIVEVNLEGTKYYIDATNPLLYFDELPSKCVNVEGLIVKPKSEEWTLVSQKNIAETRNTFNLDIDPDKAVINAEINFISKGHDAYRYRNIYKGNPLNITDYLRKKNNIHLKEDEISIKNYEELQEPFIFSFKSRIPLENESGKLFIHPFCNIAITDNPFKQDKRTLPIDLLFFKGEKYESVIEIPDGYKVDYLPKEIKHDSNSMSINYSAKQTDNKIIVQAGYEYKKNIYEAKDYLRLKYSFNEILKQLSEVVILVRE